MARLLSRIGVCLLASLLLAGAIVPAVTYAQGKSQIEKNRRKHKDLYERIGELQKGQEQLDKMVEQLDGRIKDKQEDVNGIAAQLKQAEERQGALEAEREQARLDLAKYQDKLGQRARQIYMQSDTTYLGLLLQAADVADFVDRVFFVQAVLERDETLIADTRNNQAKLGELLVAIQQQIDSISSIKGKLDTELSALEGLREDKRETLDALEEDEALYKRQADALEAENKRIEANIRRVNAAGSGYKGKWTGKFNKPCPGPITSGFGYRMHPISKYRKMHTGVDIGAPEGTPVRPGGKGKVILTGWMGGYGNAVIVDHGGGRTTLYGHLSRITCSAGDEVATSSVIGKVGSTGYSTGNHLHFEVRINGKAVDPLGSLN